MPPLPAELWIKILEFTLHLCQPADIPLYFPFIESARARQREKEQVAQDKAMLRVLNLVCRTWREMCLSFDSRRVHIQLEDMRSQAQSRIHASDCTTLSPRTVVLQISPPRSGMDPIQYAQVVEDTLAKAPSVRAVQISTGPHDSDTSVQHFLQVIQHVLSSLSKLSSLDLLSYHIFPLDIENVLSAVAGIPQLRAFRCNLEARKLPTTAPPLLPHLEILCISIDNLVSQEALEKWLRGWRMPCLTQLVNIGNWVRDDWSWILGLLEHNGTHLKALHLHDHHCLGGFPSRLWQVCPGLDTLIGDQILANTLRIPPEHIPLRTLIHTRDLDRSHPGTRLEYHARHAMVNLRPLDGGLRGEMRWSENTWEEIYTAEPPVVAKALRILVEACESLGYSALDADGVDARNYLATLNPKSIQP